MQVCFRQTRRAVKEKPKATNGDEFVTDHHARGSVVASGSLIRQAPLAVTQHTAPAMKIVTRADVEKDGTLPERQIARSAPKAKN